LRKFLDFELWSQLFSFNFNLETRPKGFEPLTYGLEIRCSIQLSYGRRQMQVVSSKVVQSYP
jgi:hypothetical protein